MGKGATWSEEACQCPAITLTCFVWSGEPFNFCCTFEDADDSAFRHAHDCPNCYKPTSGYWILAPAFCQISQTDFGAQAPSPWVHTEAPSVGLSSLEMVGLVCARGKARACIQPIAACQSRFGVQSGHPGWDDEQASLNPDSEGSDATIGKGVGWERDRWGGDGGGGGCWGFVQDNAPPNIACDTVAFLDHYDVKVM